jgi:hypothetical protein
MSFVQVEGNAKIGLLGAFFREPVELSGVRAVQFAVRVRSVTVLL